MGKTVLVATEKPFAKSAVEAIKNVFSKADYTMNILESYTDKEQLKKAIASVDALIFRSDKISPDIIEAAKNLKIAVRAGAGYDNIDIPAATKKGVVVMNTPGQNSNAVAELAFGLMLNLARRSYTGKDGTELRGKTLGVHAYGNVGKYVAMIAKGFGMNVIAYDPFVKADVMKKDGITPVSTVEELYKTSDYISLHIPFVKETAKYINYKLLSLTKKGATLINTARAEVIDEDGLAKFMEERSDFMYGSDIAPENKAVFEQKFSGRFFFTAKKIGAQTAEANNNAGIAAANQIVNFFEKNDKTFQVNK